MSIVTKSIVNADAEARYLSPGELDRIKAFVTSGERRVRIAETLTGARERIIKEAGSQLFQKRPDVVSPGGNAYTSRRMAACLRDMEIILRYVTYAIFAGDSSVLDDRCLNGLRETYQALGVPGASVAAGVQKMKETAIAIVNDTNGITRGDCSAIVAEVAGYFDRAAAAVA